MQIDMTTFKKENPDDYKSFNEFFFREIKPEVRPVGSPEDETVIISPADFRSTVFDLLQCAKDLFIMGSQFDVFHLLGGKPHGNVIKEFASVSMLNARLAPQDYHRYHAPLSGKRDSLESDVNVLTENERGVVVVDGDVCSYCFVSIGASEVGSCVTMVNSGDVVKKGDEIGYFQYGGSDIIVLFNKPVNWDGFREAVSRGYGNVGFEMDVLLSAIN
ncbi:hypothetical protein HK098_006648 [Nowakowskiella sp. JEL0407]|nr:hypothetical protein HK098_006648 [Nowakowskiella sp. JEL0407]